MSEPGARRERAPDGKRALFSSSTTPARGLVTVDCERCGGRSRISYLDLARNHLPVWFWAPWRRHANFMRCPACGHRSWLSVHWFH